MYRITGPSAVLWYNIICACKCVCVRMYDILCVVYCAKLLCLFVRHMAYLFLWLLLFSAHVSYLSLYRFDYGYNMAASVAAGVLYTAIWLLWCFKVQTAHITQAATTVYVYILLPFLCDYSIIVSVLTCGSVHW